MSGKVNDFMMIVSAVILNDFDDSELQFRNKNKCRR